MTLAAYAVIYTLIATAGLVVLRRTLENAALGEILANPTFYAGFSLYAASFLTFLASLRRFEVLTVYPLFTGLAYATVTLAAVVVLHEQLTPARIAGIVLVGAGVVLLTR